MKLRSLLGLLSLAFVVSASNIRPRNYDADDYYVLQLDPRTPPTEVASKLGLRHEGKLGELDNHHVFSTDKRDDDVVHIALNERKRKRTLDTGALDGVWFAQKQRLKPRLVKRAPIAAGPVDTDTPLPGAVAQQSIVAKELGIQDPIFNEQWHLFNPIQVGHDVNVTGVWLQGITGFNATVAIVDDGLDMDSEDLKDNYFAEGSYDFNDHRVAPKPISSDDKHGTRCAGEVAAAKNNVCGVGVAYNAKVAGIRILSKQISDADEAVALNYAYQKNHIYSCSWGPPDDGKTMDAPGILIKKAIVNGVQKGRDGKGSIFVFASGNGAASGDNCNFDGYTNSIYSITVGAVDRKGLHPYYSERCSAHLVVTYSSGSGDFIHTTDVGANSCYAGHGGTSAAAPLAAGIFALVLQVRPDLTWRDLQYLTMQTAVPIDLPKHDDDWQTTSIGKKFSHVFGYGKIDTWAIVEAAKTFKHVKPQAWFYSPWIEVNQAIPQGTDGLSVSFEVTKAMLEKANLERVEHVTVTMNVKHGRRGDLSVDLVSPDRVVSHLAETRRLDTSTSGFKDWTFMSVVHWGESGIGTWTIVVKDTEVNEHNGSFVDWHLKIWGESIDASKAVLHPLPGEHHLDDHDKIATTSIPGATQTATLVPAPTSSILDSHPDRPTNSKPTGTEEEVASSSTATKPAATSITSSWLPSFFPTFGVSSKTQIWIYGATALILVFCAGLGIYLYIARRKRLRNNPRDEWEFDLVEDDEHEGLNGQGNGASARKGSKRRAGELYDAFAAGSEGESDLEEYLDEGGEAEKRLYDDTDDEPHHVIGDDEDEVDSSLEGHNEKTRGETGV